LNYTIATTGDTFPLQGFTISGLPGDVNFGTGIDSSGAFTAPVVKGQSYTVWIEEQSNESGSVDSSGSASAAFSWSLPGGVPVPVPPSAALLGLGLASLGVMRRKTKVA
jgi:hypothetical protein